jgi:hypothetical protein
LREIKSLEDGVKHILKLSQSSQTKLIKMLDHIKTKYGKTVLIYNPKVKSYDSALRKAQNATGVPNQILRLNDGYRASVLCSNFHTISEILAEIDKVLPMYKFEKMSVLNTFERPWPNGYQDYNCRLKDVENSDLIGELQIHFCPIKLFSQTVGHLSYEILRNLNPADPHTEHVRDALQKIATAGYNSALELKDDCCFDKINELKKKYNVTDEDAVKEHMTSSEGKGRKSRRKRKSSLWGYKLQGKKKRTKHIYKSDL